MQKKELLVKSILALENINAIKLKENKNITNGYENIKKLEKQAKEDNKIAQQVLVETNNAVEGAINLKKSLENETKEIRGKLNGVNEQIKDAEEKKEGAVKDKEKAEKESKKEEIKLDKLLRKRISIAKMAEQNDQMRIELREVYEKIGEDFPYN